MTLTTQLRLFCDGCGAGFTLLGVSRRDMRALAARAKWQTRSFRHPFRPDLCPMCVKADKEGTA